MGVGANRESSARVYWHWQCCTVFMGARAYGNFIVLNLCSCFGVCGFYVFVTFNTFALLITETCTYTVCGSSCVLNWHFLGRLMCMRRYKYVS